MKYVKYLEIPYESRGRGWDGVDCYGLVQLYYVEELDIELSDKFYEDNWWKQDDAENPDFVDHADKEHFVEVNHPQEHDCIFFRVMSDVVNHIGIYTGDGKILHAHDGQGVFHEKISSAMNKCQHSIWRHKSFV